MILNFLRRLFFRRRHTIAEWRAVAEANEEYLREARASEAEWRKVAECASRRADAYEKRLRALGEKRHPSGARPEPQGQSQDRLLTYLKWAGAPHGSPEWIAYWKDGGEKRYRSLLEENWS